MSYPITDIDGIDGDVVVVLKSVGIRSTDRLLEAARTVKGRKALAEKTGFDEKKLLCWANVADRMRIKGVRQGICGTTAGRGRRYREGAQVSKSAQSRQGNGRRQQAPQAGPPVAVGKGGQALDRKRQTAAAENYLLKTQARPAGDMRGCLTAPRRPRKATGMGSARTLEINAGTATKSASNRASALHSPGRPLVMGILNVTPDSFSDGGRFLDPATAIAHAAEMVQQGADIMDIGAESTRPYGGAVTVSADDEKARLSPVLPAVIKLGCRYRSTRSRPPIASWALDQGAAIVNDVWGLQRDPDMAPLIAKRGVPVIIMHNRETADAAHRHHRRRDGFFSRSLEIAARAGIATDKYCARPRHRLWQDAGAEHHVHRAVCGIQTLRLTASGRRIAQTFHQYGDPLLPGRAHRGLDCRPSAGGQKGAAIIRVHDVAETVQALRVAAAIEGCDDERPDFHQRPGTPCLSRGDGRTRPRWGRLSRIDLDLEIDLVRRRPLGQGRRIQCRTTKSSIA